MRPDQHLMAGTRDHLALDYGSVPIPELLDRLQSSEHGLSTAAAAGGSRGRKSKLRGPLSEWLRAASILAAQFKSPITMILIGAALLSLFLRDITDSVIILSIVLAGAGLSFWQEYAAANALAGLLALVSAKVTVLRDGCTVELPSSEIVPGDVVLLLAGSAIPGDCRLLE